MSLSAAWAGWALPAGVSPEQALSRRAAFLEI